MDLLQLGEDVAKGAAVGSVVPVIGTVLGAAGAVALNLAPELGEWLFGPSAGPTIAAVQSVMKSVTGAEQPDDQVQALTNPTIAGELRVQLACIAAACAATAAKEFQDQIVAQLADVTNARATTVQLAQASSPLSWGAAIVSIVVLATFGAAMAMALLRVIPPNAEPVLNVLLGSLTAMATSVVSYWVGSSVGSARKDARIADFLSTSR